MCSSDLYYNQQKSKLDMLKNIPCTHSGRFSAYPVLISADYNTGYSFQAWRFLHGMKYSCCPCRPPFPYKSPSVYLTLFHCCPVHSVFPSARPRSRKLLFEVLQGALSAGCSGNSGHSVFLHFFSVHFQGSSFQPSAHSSCLSGFLFHRCYLRLNKSFSVLSAADCLSGILSYYHRPRAHRSVPG